MKKYNISLNFNNIRERIELDIGEMPSNDWASLIGVGTSLISNVHGKSKKQNPPLPYIIAVARHTGKPIEWYLYGETSKGSTVHKAADPRGEYNAVDPSGAGPCPVKCDEKLRKLCARVKKVMEPDDGFSKALEANIFAFEESANMKKEIQNIRQTSSMGPGGGIPQKPARSTAKRRKAG